MPVVNGVEAPKLPAPLKSRSVVVEALVGEGICRQVLLADGALDGADLRDVLFEQVHMVRLTLRGTRCEMASWRDVRLEHCDLSQAILEKAALQRLELVDCRITGWRITEAHIQDLLLRNCRGPYVSFAAARLKRARFERCVLEEASFAEADLSGAVFVECDLRGADMAGAKLLGTDLRGCTISGLRIGPRELQGLKVDLAQAGQLLQGLGAAVSFE